MTSSHPDGGNMGRKHHILWLFEGIWDHYADAHATQNTAASLVQWLQQGTFPFNTDASFFTRTRTHTAHTHIH